MKCIQYMVLLQNTRTLTENNRFDILHSKIKYIHIYLRSTVQRSSSCNMWNVKFMLLLSKYAYLISNIKKGKL